MKGKLNVHNFLKRALEQNMSINYVSFMIREYEDKILDLEYVKCFYSNRANEWCYNINGFAILGNEIDIIFN